MQREHGLGSLFGGMIRNAAPLIKSGGIALGKRALKTGLNVAADVLSDQSLNNSAKRRVKEAGKDIISTLLRGEKPPGIRDIRKRPIKRKLSVATASPSKKHRRRKTRPVDIFGI